MADTVVLNNYSDDSRIKEYIMNVLAPRVFHDIPINVLNTGQFSLINEYISQALENLSFTGAFYFNESFITKAALADSIYSEAAIFNIGYSYATPSSCNMLLELRIDDLLKNAVYNSDSGLYEFILDKNTQFNLSNGNVYSLDYDILIQYKNVETATITGTHTPAWNVQYTNMNDMNFIAVNKTPYILYRVSEKWLCLFVKVSEFERETHVVVNNMTNGIPNADEVITCTNHIAGFDIRYIDGDGNSQYLDHDHILPMHSDVKDQQPYVHYIMDSPKTIRFMFQLNGTRYFVPKLNSSFEITIYTCHGESANFTAFKQNEEQPSVITASNRFSNNGNVMKAAFVISGSTGGTNIGTIETVRRETIEAYNTANVISTDHDIYEWFKTFFFKNVLYPFFFKRRDDPWGKVWAGFIALKDDDDKVFRTNTVHAQVPYALLASNGTMYDNEMIIPPGIVWVYKENEGGRYTVIPPASMDTSLAPNERIFEMANTVGNIDAPFVFANPFGIRIQKEPFAIGYFNPWINEYVTASLIPGTSKTEPDVYIDDYSIIYHATPTIVHVVRTFKDNYYLFSVNISPTTNGTYDGKPFVSQLKSDSITPTFSNGQMWTYMKHPTDLSAHTIPILPLTENITFDPMKTYLCTNSVVRDDADSHGRLKLNNWWIEDASDENNIKVINLPMNGISYVIGDDYLWNPDTIEPVAPEDPTDITIYPASAMDVLPIEFARVDGKDYYEMRIKEDATSRITKIETSMVYETTLTKYAETKLWRIGNQYQNVSITIHTVSGNENNVARKTVITIENGAAVFIPYAPTKSVDGIYTFDLENALQERSIILYADMKAAPSADSVNYYRIPFSAVNEDGAIVYLVNSQLDLTLNNLRVVMATKVNGTYTGRLEMTPVQVQGDGSVMFQAIMYPINQLVDADNRINIASTAHHGGSWIPASENGMVSIDATNPEIELAVMFRSDDITLESYTEYDDTFIGFRLADRWKVDELSLIQELKEMRSVVKFDRFPETYPTEDVFNAYNINTCPIPIPSILNVAVRVSVYIIVVFSSVSAFGSLSVSSLSFSSSGT